MSKGVHLLQERTRQGIQGCTPKKIFKMLDARIVSLVIFTSNPSSHLVVLNIRLLLLRQDDSLLSPTQVQNKLCIQLEGAVQVYLFSL